MPFKRPLAKREIVGLSVIAACLAGVAIVAVVLLSGDDGSGQSAQTQTNRSNGDSTAPNNGGSDGGGPSGNPNGGGSSPSKAPRRPVPVPGFSVGVVEKGKVPHAVTRKLGDALNDGTLTSGELRGTPTVLTALASKCDFCGPEARLLQAEWKLWAPRGVLYLGLSVRESPEEARTFSDRFGLDFPVVSDRSGKTTRSFAISGIPETVFISGKGRVVGRVMGGASIGQLQVGSAAAGSNQSAGVEQGGARLPIP
jgi:peroxiredoxin